LWTSPALRALAAAIGVVWWNAYIVRQTFGMTFMGQMHSMHGYWEAVGRWGATRGWLGTWIDWFAGGTPVEWAYTPLVPFLVHCVGAPPVNALAYCLGPVALYFLAWRLTDRVLPSLAVAGFHTLLSPTQWIVPDGSFGWAKILESRRMYVTFGWDETPHELGFACACVVTAAWMRGQWRLAAAACVIGSLASPFCVTACAMLGVCWLLASGWRRWPIFIATGGLSYLIVAPWYSPSMLATVRRNGALTPEGAWTDTSWIALSVAFLLLGGIAWLTRRKDSALRFALLSLALWTAIPVLFIRWGLRFVEQPGRYKTEMEAAIALALVVVAIRLPRWAVRTLAAAALIGAVWLTIEQRRLSKRYLVASEAETTIEFQVADWAWRNLPGKTLFAPGSTGQWLNAFRDVRQFSGGAYTTAPNPEQQRLANELLVEKDPQRALELLRRARVDAVVMPGPKSPEFWKPFRDGDVFAGHLPVLWNERDTVIYAVPGGGGPPFTEPFHDRLEFRLCRWASLLGLILFVTPFPGRLALRGASYQMVATGDLPLSS